MTGGDPVLRDAEHYLFRYWLGSMGTKFRRIPNGLPIKGSPNPTIWLNSTVVENVHDPAYNALRPVLEKVLNIAPTTPEMKGWEQRGFREGYCAPGDCETGKRVQELPFGTDLTRAGRPRDGSAMRPASAARLRSRSGITKAQSRLAVIVRLY
jgi:hypothetical protein